jgi:chemotaxis protein histidine kinase CheA
MAEDGISREPMLEMYLFEATQLMEWLEEISIECEKNKKSAVDAINEIFRKMHTIKSSKLLRHMKQAKGEVSKNHPAEKSKEIKYYISSYQNSIEAKNAGSDVFIIVTDDGRWLDRRLIYEKAKLKVFTNLY